MACEVSGEGVMVTERQEDAMRVLWLVVMAVAVATAVMVWSAVPVNAQEVDQGPVRCRDFPFPFSVLCLANAASYRDQKMCPEIGQYALKPAGQQCEPGRAEARSFGDPGRSRGGKECQHPK